MVNFMMLKADSWDSISFLPAGLTIVDTPSTGDCFYYALTVNIPEKNPQNLRELTGKYIYENRALFLESFAAYQHEYAIDLDTYIRYIINPNETPFDLPVHISWADDIEIQALSLAMEINIVILENDGHIAKQTLPDSTSEPIFILFNGTNHYSGLEVSEWTSASQILYELIHPNSIHSPGK